MSSKEKPKLLIVSLNFPYPLNNGGAIAQSFFLEGLENDFRIYLVTIIDDPEVLEDFKKQLPAIRVINLHDFSKDNDPGFVFKVKMGVSNTLKKLSGSRSSLYIHEDHLESDYVKNLINIKPSRFLFLLNELIAKEKIEIVQLEFFETLDLVLGLPAGIKTIFVNHELRSKRVRLASEHSRTSVEYQNYLIKLTELYEYELLRKYDKVVVFNSDDQLILKNNGIKGYLSPYGIPDVLHLRKTPSSSFNKLLFLGGESHFPNKEGLTWFLDNIFNKLNETSSHPIWIVGKWSLEFRLRYKNNKNIIFKGMVKSVHDCFESAIMIAPILSGSGLRTKILDAMVNYVPVFCTPFACEGIEIFPGAEKPLELFSGFKEFSIIIKNHSDKSLQQLALAGNQYYNQHFDHHKLVNIRKGAYLE